MKYLFLTLALAFSSPAWSIDFGACNVMFPKKTPPKLEGLLKVKPLCYDSFAVLYSYDSKNPVFVVEKLNYLRLGSKETRKDNFHEEAMLDKKLRATLKDYEKSGYDRGHMAPAADMPNSLAMEQSFSLANMVPQAPKLNRGIWAKNVEKTVRDYVKKKSQGDVYVFTGPYYSSSNPKTIGKSKVWVPDYVFKLVYDEGTGKSWVYFLENVDTVRMSAPISYEELEKKTGLKLLNK